jgi:hypothetical protein
MADFYDIDVSSIGAEERTVNEKLLRFELGDTNIRILPPWREGAQFYKPYKMHFALNELKNYGLEVDGWFAEPCLSEVSVFDGQHWNTQSGRCPLCALANEAWRIGAKDNSPDLTNLSKRIRAKRQYASNVVNLSEMEKGVQVMVYGKKIFDGAKALFVRRGNITHPVKGYNIFVTKSEIQGQKWCDYTVTQDEQTDFTGPWEELAPQLHNLDEFPEYSKYDDIKERIETIKLSHEPVSKVHNVPEGYSSPNNDTVDELLNFDD